MGCRLPLPGHVLYSATSQKIEPRGCRRLLRCLVPINCVLDHRLIMYRQGVVVNFRLDTVEARLLGLECHVAELQLVFRDFPFFKVLAPCCSAQRYVKINGAGGGGRDLSTSPSSKFLRRTFRRSDAPGSEASAHSRKAGGTGGAEAAPNDRPASSAGFAAPGRPVASNGGLSDGAPRVSTGWRRRLPTMRVTDENPSSVRRGPRFETSRSWGWVRWYAGYQLRHGAVAVAGRWPASVRALMHSRVGGYSFGRCWSAAVEPFGPCRGRPYKKD